MRWTWSMVSVNPSPARSRATSADTTSSAALTFSRNAGSASISKTLVRSGVVRELVVESCMGSIMAERHQDAATSSCVDPCCVPRRRSPRVETCPRRSTDEKSELLAKAIDLALCRKGAGGPPPRLVGGLLKSYYRHVAPEDVTDRTDVDLYGALASHYKLAGNRPQGTAQVRVFTPAVSEHGWSAGGHSVVEVVTDDMPFLVDSLTMELTRQLRDVHVVIHPQFDVVRDITGALQCGDAGRRDGSVEPPEDALRESWMHIEIAARPRRRGRRRDRGVAAAGAARRPRVRRGLGRRCTPRCWRSSTSSSRRRRR